jgi:prolyl oligopeptidase
MHNITGKLRNALAALVIVFLALWATARSSAQWTYPPTKSVDASDSYFGHAYSDPYRWLENLKDKDVETWFTQQAGLTDGVLAKIPGRKALVDEWVALDKLKPASFSGIIYKNGRIFYKKTIGGENVGKLYFRDGLEAPEKLLYDPAGYSKDGKSVIQSFLPSWDGKHVVLGLSAGGAEWSELRVLAVADRTLLPDSVYPSWGANGWSRDNESFFYDAGKEKDIKSVGIELSRQAHRHKLGSPAGDDVDLLSDESCQELGIAPKEIPSVGVDEDLPGYCFGQAGTVQKEMRMFYASAPDSNGGKPDWKVLCKLSDNIVDFTAHGEFAYGVTHAGAPKFKVVRTPLKSSDWDHAETVLPEASDSVDVIVKSSRFLFAVYSNGIVGRIVKYEFATGKTSEVKLPASGTVSMSCPDWKNDLCHIVITSWTMPPIRYDYAAATDTISKSAFNADVTYPGFEGLVAEEVEVPSYDGTLVPLSIIHQKQLALDGSSSCILEGYGAYGMSLSPHFNIRASVATHGVVLAYAHPRGGGEKGEGWYQAGHKATKPNTWKDYIACAEYLVEKGYTSPEKLAGTGTSAGGILISRAVTDRPDLFRAAICNVGCANAMRLEFSANGPVNIPEFGTVQDSGECQALFEMDGVQHVRSGVKYPAVMGVAGWNDPRVAPWQPGKFVAALQNAAQPGRPVFLKVNYDNGHFTEDKTVTFNNFAGQMAFLLWQTGHRDFQPGE